MIFQFSRYCRALLPPISALLFLGGCRAATPPNHAASTRSATPVKSKPRVAVAKIVKSTKNATTHAQRVAQQDIEMRRGLRGQLLQIAMPMSALLHRQITALVYLPPDYRASASTRYPVAYLLHGAPGAARDWFVNAQAHRVAEKLILSKQIAPLILVAFDAMGPRGVNDVADYLDRADDSWPMESFMVRELVPWVDKTFRTLPKPQARALVGFSAGGYGAANLGLKHPNVWSVMASHSGFFDADDEAKNMTDILGALPAARPLWDANSPILLARKLPRGSRLHFYMDCGRSDALLGEFWKMRDELLTHQIDHESDVVEGHHTARYVQRRLPFSLRFCDRRWKEMAEQNAAVKAR